MKLKVEIIIEEDVNNISTVVEKLAEELDIWSISLTPIEEKGDD